MPDKESGVCRKRQNNMKWPALAQFVRHDVSQYNVLKARKASDPLYQEFLVAYRADFTSAECRNLAEQVHKKFSLPFSDQATPLIEINSKTVVNTGINLRAMGSVPDVIFVSPYRRTLETLAGLTVGYPELAQVKTYKEERIREQSHGLAGLFNDYKVFYTFYPDQRRLHDQDGEYWYQWPQGESVSDVRLRVLSFLTTLTRDFNNKKVLIVSHHLALLAFMANLERWDATEFERVDEEEKPINCGVTTYVGDPNVGKNGKFKLTCYNRDLSKVIA